MDKFDILIAGVGGQGTILAGNIISRVALVENLDVKTAETHGMAQRGGSVVTHVRLGPKVYSPLIPKGDVDYLLSFEKLEAFRNLPFLSAESTILVNSQVILPLPVLTGSDEYPEGIIEEISHKVKKTYFIDALNIEPVKSQPRVLNTFLLGVLAYFLPVSLETWEYAIEKSLPQKLVQMNINAFQSGYAWINST